MIKVRKYTFLLFALLSFNSFALPLDIFPDSGAGPVFVEVGYQGYANGESSINENNAFFGLGLKVHNMIIRGIFNSGFGLEAGAYKSLSPETDISVGVGTTEVSADVNLTINANTFTKEAINHVNYIWIELSHDVLFVRVSRINADFSIGETRQIGIDHHKKPIFESDHNGFSDDFYLINFGYRFQ